MSNSSAPRFDARWERNIADRDGDTLALMITVTAPQDHPAAARPPIALAFALDRSGSMSGEPIRLVREAAATATRTLDPNDRVALVVYDHRVEVLHGLQPAGDGGREGLIRALDGVEARGSTNLGEGWLTACRQLTVPQARGASIRRALLLTDGLANVGITSIDELVEHAREQRKHGITTSTLGVGAGFDENLLSSMAEAGGGEFQYISEPRQLPNFFDRELGRMLSTTMSHLHLFLTLPPGARGKLISFAAVERDRKTFDVAIGDLPDGETQHFVFEIRTSRGGAAEALEFGALAEWIDPATGHAYEVEIPVTPLRAASATEAKTAPVDLEVAEQAALQRAAADQREAMRLDRLGRYSESRQLHSSARDRLASAPHSDTVRLRQEEASAYAAFSPDHAFPEDVRKQSVHNIARRGRGRADES
jgi:Ca-activated chloride channel homolog